LIDLIGFAPAQFTSAGVAQAMAVTAYQRASHLVDNAEPVVGVSCTATIATDRVKRGDHRCGVAVYDAASLRQYHLVLRKGQRTRQQEEQLVSLLIIKAIAAACQVNDELALELSAAEVLEEHFESVRLLPQMLAGEVAWLTISSAGNITRGETLSGVILLSGSFNPLHQGHRQLAEIAARRLQRPLFFELPLVNAAKGQIQPEETLRRSAQFIGFAPLLLTQAPLFSQKAELFPNSVFIVGADTAMRLLQPRFYHDDPAEMFAAFDTIQRQGCHFLVAGRVEPDEDHFLTMADVDIPAGYQDLFEQIPEADFRLDISSSEIRTSFNRD
jgi:nicotinic acid mononucleotide adenylyltransferase